MKQLQELLAQIDFLYQEGVICYPSDAKTMKLCGDQLRGFAYDIEFQACWKKANKTA